MGATIEEARAAKASLRAQLAGVTGVRAIGVALLSDGYGVKVLVERLPEGYVVPSEIDGIPVLVESVGELSLL